MEYASRTILYVTQQFILYTSYVCLISGFIGNALNIIIFACLKIFRGNQCAFYIVVESIADCGVLLNIFVLRIFYHGFGIDLLSQSLILCKISRALLQACVLISLTTICFGAVDQYLTTKHHTSTVQIARLKLAQRLTLINVVTWFLHGIPYAIFYEILPVVGCEISNKIFRLYFSICYLSVLNGVLPLLVSSIFSALAYRNVRRIIRQQVTTARRRLDRQLTAIILIRVVFLVAVSIPYGIDLLYDLNAPRTTENLLRIAIEQLIVAITSSLFYVNYAVSVFFIEDVLRE